MTFPPSIFQVGHLERVPLGTPYPGIVAHVGRLLDKLPAGTELVIDLTGVGRPIFDMFVYSGISPLGVLITAGASETRDGPICGVPKLTLVSRLQALLHEGRLKILRELAEAETLVRELQDFRVEFTAAGHLTFNARTGKHDDLVLALAIAVWRAYGGGMASYDTGDYGRGSVIQEVQATGKSRTACPAVRELAAGGRWMRTFGIVARVRSVARSASVIDRSVLGWPLARLAGVDGVSLGARLSNQPLLPQPGPDEQTSSMGRVLPRPRWKGL